MGKAYVEGVYCEFISMWIHMTATCYVHMNKVCTECLYDSICMSTETEILSFWWNFHHWLPRKLSSGAISNENFVEITTFPLSKFMNIFLCGLQWVEAARAAMVQIVHEIRSYSRMNYKCNEHIPPKTVQQMLMNLHPTLGVARLHTYTFVNSNRIQDLRRDAFYKVHIQ